MTSSDGSFFLPVYVCFYMCIYREQCLSYFTLRVEQLIGDSVSQSFIFDVFICFVLILLGFCVCVWRCLFSHFCLDFGIYDLPAAEFLGLTSKPLWCFFVLVSLKTDAVLKQATTLFACVSLTYFLFTACYCITLLRCSSTDFHHITCFFWIQINTFVSKLHLDDIFIHYFLSEKVNQCFSQNIVRCLKRI